MSTAAFLAAYPVIPVALTTLTDVDMLTLWDTEEEEDDEDALEEVDAVSDADAESVSEDDASDEDADEDVADDDEEEDDDPPANDARREACPENTPQTAMPTRAATTKVTRTGANLTAQDREPRCTPTGPAGGSSKTSLSTTPELGCLRAMMVFPSLH